MNDRHAPLSVDDNRCWTSSGEGVGWGRSTIIRTKNADLCGLHTHTPLPNTRELYNQRLDPPFAVEPQDTQDRRATIDGRRLHQEKYSAHTTGNPSKPSTQSNPTQQNTVGRELSRCSGKPISQSRPTVSRLVGQKANFGSN